MLCKHCGESDYRKDGILRGKQRYRCKHCMRCFSGGDGRTGYNDHQKLAALALYKEGMGLRGIGRYLGVSYQTVLRWTQTAGEEIKRIVRSDLPKDLPSMDMIVIDEMWHYTQKACPCVGREQINCGYGLLYLPAWDASSLSKWVLVVLKPSSGSGQGLHT